jgi:hypothetical protein
VLSDMLHQLCRFTARTKIRLEHCLAETEGNAPSPSPRRLSF